MRRRAFAEVEAEADFPSFSEGLSLRLFLPFDWHAARAFPFLFGGTFIEAQVQLPRLMRSSRISLPFRRDFH